jgi:hypothetical protein
MANTTTTMMTIQSQVGMCVLSFAKGVPDSTTEPTSFATESPSRRRTGSRSRSQPDDMRASSANRQSAFTSCICSTVLTSALEPARGADELDAALCTRGGAFGVAALSLESTD